MTEQANVHCHCKHISVCNAMYDTWPSYPIQTSLHAACCAGQYMRLYPCKWAIHKVWSLSVCRVSQHDMMGPLGSSQS